MGKLKINRRNALNTDPNMKVTVNRYNQLKLILLILLIYIFN